MNSAIDQENLCLERAACIQLISTFIPEPDNLAEQRDRGGNPCALSILENAPDETVQPVTGITLCQSWPTNHDGQPVIAVACYTGGGLPIQCCGHGLLAAAHSWQQKLQCDELSLLMHNSLVHSWCEQNDTWLRFKRLPTTALPVPEWVEGVFPGLPPPIAAAACGDEQGYVILRWPDEFGLRQLDPSLARFSKQSQRALICTSAHPSLGADAIQLRYFAPQYGVAEDPATGSAMRVLADYWSNRFSSLTAQQCSAEEGLLLARVTPEHVEVGGRCQITPMKTNNA